MADQKRIVLRSGHADPKTIVLYDLPVADVSSGTQIVLYEFNASASTIVLRNPAEAPEVGGTVEIALAATEAPDVFAGAAGLVAEIALAVSEAPDDFSGTISAVSSLALAATEAPDTFEATAVASEVSAGGAGAEPTASGGAARKRREVPVPPKHLTYMVFSDEPRPVSQEEPPRGLIPSEAPAAEGNASRPSAAAPSPETVAAIASTLAGQVEAAAPPAMPELIAGNDDEEAMMIILALAA